MALDRKQIVDAATDTLREHGLAGLSMRRLAAELGVQPGALYHHVASKQDLLAAVGEHVLAASGAVPDDPAKAAARLRETLLSVRDGAEVISFVYAYRPDALARFGQLGDALIRYVLGFVAVEQNRAELIRARILEPGPPEDAAFVAGVAAFTRVWLLAD